MLPLRTRLQTTMAVNASYSGSDYSSDSDDDLSTLMVKPTAMYKVEAPRFSETIARERRKPSIPVPAVSRRQKKRRRGKGRGKKGRERGKSSLDNKDGSSSDSDHPLLNVDLTALLEGLHRNYNSGDSFLDDSDGDYFEYGPDGTVRLKKGKRKIDLSKLSHDDLRKLGIDPNNMTKEQIAKILKVCPN